ncbi:MAG: hypothetical protein IAG13_11815, partial [Deltaproteobacteria bacterium]|nr:hypothetical protein [Nannocystaceae bacterium]
GRRLVSLELGMGQIDRLAPADVRDHVESLDAATALDLSTFDAALDEVLESTARHDASAIDPRAAVAIHRSLPLVRRAAADAGLWRWLAVVHRPDFVRHRWELRVWTTMRDRFWKAGTRPDSNAIGRLWWIAELTRRGDDYSDTQTILRNGSLATPMFVRRLCEHAPFVHACARVLADQPGFVIERVLARFNMLASTIPLEGRGEEQIVDALERLLEEVGAARWST